MWCRGVYDTPMVAFIFCWTIVNQYVQYGEIPSPAVSSLQPSYITRLTKDCITDVIMKARGVARWFAIIGTKKICFIF